MSEFKFFIFYILGRPVSEKHYNGHGDYEEFRYLKILKFHLDIDSGIIYKSR